MRHSHSERLTWDRGAIALLLVLSRCKNDAVVHRDKSRLGWVGPSKIAHQSNRALARRASNFRDATSTSNFGTKNSIYSVASSFNTSYQMASHAEEVIVIDRTGDGFLTLNNPGAAFAVWERSDDNQGSDDTLQPDEENGSDEEALTSARRKRKATLTGQLLERRPKRERSDADPVDASNCQPLGFDGVDEAPSRVYQVSSRHLIKCFSKVSKRVDRTLE